MSTQECYTVYELVDCVTRRTYYVGYSNDYLRRYREHKRNYRFQELEEQGIRLMPVAIENVTSREQAIRSERKRIAYHISIHSPLVNVDGVVDFALYANAIAHRLHLPIPYLEKKGNNT